jgi:hypothetical protein
VVVLIDPLCWDEFGGWGSADGKKVPPKWNQQTSDEKFFPNTCRLMLQ